MRKHIISLFLLICPTIANAIVISSNCDQDELCLDMVNANGKTYCNRSGCGIQTYNNETYCRKCTAGYFSSLTQSPKFDANTCDGIDWLRTNLICEECKLNGKHDIKTEISDALTWSAVADNATNGATSNADCGIDITCSAGQYYDPISHECTACPSGTFSDTTKVVTTDIGTIQNIPSSAFCTKCGANATANDDRTDCNCMPGYHTSDQKTNDVGGAECVAIEYDAYYALTYNDNDPSRQQDTNGTISVATPYKLLDMQSGSVPDLTQTGYNFANKWQANKKLMTIEAGSTPTLLPADTQISSGTQVYSYHQDLGDVTLVPIWTPKTFTVTYINGTDQITSDCTYENCQASDAPTTTDDTKYFAGWECTSGCRNTATTILYQPDEDISKISDGNDMELTAIWNDCPAGHYCTNNTVNPCPAGSTSNPGSTNITDCYINHLTQFCDSNGGNCFSIGSEKEPFQIKYSGPELPQI